MNRPREKPTVLLFLWALRGDESENRGYSVSYSRRAGRFVVRLRADGADRDGPIRLRVSGHRQMESEAIESAMKLAALKGFE